MLRKRVVLLSIVYLLLCCSQSYAWSLLGMGGPAGTVMEAGGSSSVRSGRETGGSISGFSLFGGGEKKESSDTLKWAKDLWGVLTGKSDKGSTGGHGLFGVTAKENSGGLLDTIRGFFDKLMPDSAGLKVEQRTDLAGKAEGFLGYKGSDSLSANPIDVVKGTSFVKVTTLNDAAANGESIPKGSVFYVNNDEIITRADHRSFFWLGKEVSKDPDAVEIKLSDGTTGRWVYCNDLKTEEDVKKRIQ